MTSQSPKLESGYTQKIILKDTYKNEYSIIEQTETLHIKHIPSGTEQVYCKCNHCEGYFILGSPEKIGTSSEYYHGAKFDVIRLNFRGKIYYKLEVMEYIVGVCGGDPPKSLYFTRKEQQETRIS